MWDIFIKFIIYLYIILIDLCKNTYTYIICYVLKKCNIDFFTEW